MVGQSLDHVEVICPLLLRQRGAVLHQTLEWGDPATLGGLLLCSFGASTLDPNFACRLGNIESDTEPKCDTLVQAAVYLGLHVVQAAFGFKDFQVIFQFLYSALEHVQQLGLDNTRARAWVNPISECVYGCVMTTSTYQSWHDEWVIREHGLVGRFLVLMFISSLPKSNTVIQVEKPAMSTLQTTVLMDRKARCVQPKCHYCRSAILHEALILDPVRHDLLHLSIEHVIHAVNLSVSLTLCSSHFLIPKPIQHIPSTFQALNTIFKRGKTEYARRTA